MWIVYLKNHKSPHDPWAQLWFIEHDGLDSKVHYSTRILKKHKIKKEDMNKSFKELIQLYPM